MLSVATDLNDADRAIYRALELGFDTTRPRTGRLDLLLGAHGWRARHQTESGGASWLSIRAELI